MQNNLLNEKISFNFCDFLNQYHCNKLIELIDLYMKDPMGNAKPLNQDQQKALIEGLKCHTFSFILFIAVNGDIVGLTTCFINFSTFKARYYINIHDIIIKDEYRGKGLGRKLLEKCIEISQERGYCKITLEVRDDNHNAKYLYQSLGFKESEPIMHFWTKTL